MKNVKLIASGLNQIEAQHFIETYGASITENLFAIQLIIQLHDFSDEKVPENMLEFKGKRIGDGEKFFTVVGPACVKGRWYIYAENPDDSDSSGTGNLLLDLDEWDPNEWIITENKTKGVET